MSWWENTAWMCKKENEWKIRLCCGVCVRVFLCHRISEKKEMYSTCGGGGCTCKAPLTCLYISFRPTLYLKSSVEKYSWETHREVAAAGVKKGWKEKGGRIVEVIQSSGSISGVYVENETMSVFRPSSFYRPLPPAPALTLSLCSSSLPSSSFGLTYCFPEKGYFCQTAKRICILWITTCCFYFIEVHFFLSTSCSLIHSLSFFT